MSKALPPPPPPPPGYDSWMDFLLAFSSLGKNEDGVLWADFIDDREEHWDDYCKEIGGGKDWELSPRSSDVERYAHAELAKLRETAEQYE